ncbi:MAG: phospholipase D-like domain-containing protein [Bdellovibrionota bacterium]
MKLSNLVLRVLLCGLALSGAHANAGRKPVTVPANGFYENAKGSPVLGIINAARSRIDMEMYEMDDPKVIAALRDALGRGVKVHIVKEPNPVGAPCKVFESDKSKAKQGGGQAADCDDQTQLVDDVTNAGGKYVPFTKPDLCGDPSKSCLEHGKLIVIDSSVAMVSTGNLNTSNLCDLEFDPKTCNRDYTYVTDDADIVTSLQKVVDKDVIGKAYDVGSVIVRGADKKVTVGPNSLDPIVTFIKSAQSKIQIENQYLKEPTINEALIAAAKSGVDVQVTVASECSFGKPSPSEIKKTTATFKAFDAAGITSTMFTKNIKVNGKQGYLHAKAIVIDDSKAWVGSVNGSVQATTLNREFGVFFDNKADVKALAAMLTADLNDKNGETWQESLACAENN